MSEEVKHSAALPDLKDLIKGLDMNQSPKEVSGAVLAHVINQSSKLKDAQKEQLMKLLSGLEAPKTMKGSKFKNKGK
ncbi:hypothetical protein [Fictibacillus terranigra]|uniref:Stage VI sporulation protein F n=1 Tax=Fictibacillus terranigra TaxID=3058424 RepID=A0ABT8E6X0_9BACL|nr:hypothetical protein [Fictibacillus sp. CENA-BCM004]MDN4073656.1 hypothetical protein [Fictibacillus sp. CENA-BCM004]